MDKKDNSAKTPDRNTVPLPKPLKEMSHADMWNYGNAMMDAHVPWDERVAVLHDWERVTGEKWRGQDECPDKNR